MTVEWFLVSDRFIFIPARQGFFWADLKMRWIYPLTWYILYRKHSCVCLVFHKVCLHSSTGFSRNTMSFFHNKSRCVHPQSLPFRGCRSVSQVHQGLIILLPQKRMVNTKKITQDNCGSTVHESKSLTDKTRFSKFSIYFPEKTRAEQRFHHLCRKVTPESGEPREPILDGWNGQKFGDVLVGNR